MAGKGKVQVWGNGLVLYLVGAVYDMYDMDKVGLSPTNSTENFIFCKIE